MSFLLEQKTLPFYVFRVKRNTEEDLPGLSIVKGYPAKTFKSFIAMEQFCVELILDHAPMTENPHMSDGDPIDADFALGNSVSPFLLNIAGNNVARNSLRGIGTVLLYSVTYDKKLNETLAQAKLKDELLKGAKIKHIVYSKSVPFDMLISIYVNETNPMDGPFIYHKDADGYHLYWDEESFNYTTVIPI